MEVTEVIEVIQDRAYSMIPDTSRIETIWAIEVTYFIDVTQFHEATQV